MVDRNILNEYSPDEVSHPGETIRDLLEEIKLNQADLAVRMGRPRKTINEILKGKSSITPETAIQLERVLGVPARFWMSRQADYDHSLARVADRKMLNDSTVWVAKFPIKEMQKLGWLAEHRNKIDKSNSLLNFLGVATPADWTRSWSQLNASFRESPAFIKSPEAVSAWLRKGESVAQTINCGDYSKEGFLKALMEVRKLTCLDPEKFKPQMIELCASAGVAVALVPPLKGVTVFGVTRWLRADRALIQLSLRGKFEDIFWFTLFHEACHILNHSKRQVFLEANDSSSREEVEANEFAVIS